MFSLVCALFCLPPLVGAQDQSPLSAPRQGAGSTFASWKLLFSGSQDITDTWGKLHFGVTPVRLIRE